MGRVTRPGLDQPVGNAAINHVPREMITREVQEVCRICDFHGTLHILILCRMGKHLQSVRLIQDWGLSGESQYWGRQELWNR